MEPCCLCRGAAHDATGARYTSTAIACGPCVRDFWAWFARHQQAYFRVGSEGAARKRFVRFYDHVAPPTVPR